MEENYFDKERARLQVWLNSPEYQKKLEERIKIQDACQRSREAQVLTFGLCQEDPVFFIENFGWTFDPRPEHEPNHFPFILFDFQRELIYWLKDHVENGKDGLIEKSRDMGVTWCFVWFAYWLWRFKPNSSGLLGSYKEALVDDRTRNSLFGMLDYALQNTPKWLMPQRFKMKDHRQKLKLTNPENGNLISGDSMNPDFSRGSRRGYVFLDEGASWEYFREAWESAGDVTSCRLTCSTPKGKNAFSILRDSGIDYITLHWRKHPFKDEEWYEYQKKRRTDEEIAQEIDISYHRSQTGRVYPEWDNVEYGFYPYEERLPLYCSWDFGYTDETALIWFQAPQGEKVRIIDAYSNHGKTIDFYVPFVTGVVPGIDYHYNKKDLDLIESHKNWKRATHFGDPAGRSRNQVADKSVLDVLRGMGIYVNVYEEAKEFEKRRNATKLLLRELVVNDNERTKELGAAIENSHYPQIVRGGMENVRTIKPVHDFSSHFRSSLEYFAVGFQKMNGRRSEVKDKFPPRERKRIIAY